MKDSNNMTYEAFLADVLKDYKLAYMSRQMSIVARQEVLMGRAKFGILGDGKEVAQLALAKQFRKGDWRSGYYRDQTWMLATGMTTLDEFFAQLYGETSLEHNPSNGGRAFNNHYATRSLDEQGEWKDLMAQNNSSSDISPTALQMPRLLGLAYASKLFRENKDLHDLTTLTNKGNEVAFGSIGDASTSEGPFFETINAAGVLQVPMAISVWDDGYGISVPKKLQTTKESISEVLRGFEKQADTNGIRIYKCKGWDYVALCEMYALGIRKCREEHVPVLFHVEELTQPLGHSSSGSHERYKDTTQLQWEAEHDCLSRFRSWIIEKKFIADAELIEIESQLEQEVKDAKKNVYKRFRAPYEAKRKELIHFVDQRTCKCSLKQEEKVNALLHELKTMQQPIHKDVNSIARRMLYTVCSKCNNADGLYTRLSEWVKKDRAEGNDVYSSYVYLSGAHSSLNVKTIKPTYAEVPEMVNGSEVLRANFDVLFAAEKRLVIFGEDCGKLGDVNQGLMGLQKKYGEHRVIDTGIREITILGQGIGLSLRGLRPIAEIQYLDYLLYALQVMSDDLANTHWRTAGGQVAPLIIRTRGHRFEGIWHAGSPLGMILDSCRGIYICVPRNMTQAAGFYNTLLEGQDPALVIEPLKAYRNKEALPENCGTFKLALGEVEVLKEGEHITLITYGSCVPVALEAATLLEEYNISLEVIDVQTLLPFDISHRIIDSIKKTGRVIFLDEDVPGGASAYMMYKVMEEQGAFFYLDSAPKLISSHEHRPAYSTDGDYFSNPNVEDVFDFAYEMMHEAYPDNYKNR